MGPTLSSRSRQRGFWNFVIPAAASIIGGILGKQGQQDANAQNLQIAREQMDFQERMSSSAYQRGVKDMQAAGLNPMLAYQQGGASAPAGQTATMQNDMAPLAAGVTSSAGQAVELAKSMQTMENIQAQTDKTKADTARTVAETLSPQLYQQQGYSNLSLTHEQTAKTWSDQQRNYQEIANLVAAITGIQARSDSEQAQFNEMKNRGGFAADVEKRKAESAISGYGVSEAKSVSEFWNKAQDAPKWIQLLMQVLRTTKYASK